MRKTMLAGLLLLCMAQTQAKKIKPQVVKPDSATCQKTSLQPLDNPLSNHELKTTSPQSFNLLIFNIKKHENTFKITNCI
jgi:hypothetical protein